MELFYLLIAAYVIFLGAVFGRLDGGGIAKVSEWLERSLIMFFFVLACAPIAHYWAILAYFGVVGIATGHGQYFLNLSAKAVSGERTDFIARFIFGDDPRTNIKYIKYRNDGWSDAPQEIKDQIYLEMQDYGLNKLYWRNVFGMFVTGSLVGIPACIISISFGELYGLLFLLTGPAKAIAYMMGQKFWGNTEQAEFINGGLRNGICLAIVTLFFSSD